MCIQRRIRIDGNVGRGISDGDEPTIVYNPCRGAPRGTPHREYDDKDQRRTNRPHMCDGSRVICGPVG